MGDLSLPAGSQRFRARWRLLALPLVVVAVLLAIGISETAYRNATGSLAKLEQRTQAVEDIQKLLRGVLDAEAGQRGYLLTGRPDYLQPYTGSIDEVSRSLRALSDRSSGDSAVQGIVEELSQRTQEKFSELKTTIEMFNEGRHDAWRELVLTNIGMEKMVAIRQSSTALLDIESGRITAERAHVLRTLQISRIGIAVLVVLGVLALLLYLRLVRDADGARHRHAQELLDERDHLEREVTQRTAELTELTSHLQSAREDERSRLARELHDELGALLTAAKIDVARLKRSLSEAPPAVDERLEHLGSTLNAGIALKRRIIEDLRPSSLSNLGLDAALEIQAREFETRSEVRLQLTLKQVALSDSAQITVYRLVQEALTNIAKYAQATQVHLSMQPEGSLMHVSVRDDGIGFDPQAVVEGSHGLTGMRYRVQAEGGRLQVDAAPGRGTVIEAWLPQKVGDNAA